MMITHSSVEERLLKKTFARSKIIALEKSDLARSYSKQSEILHKGSSDDS
jgi:hypothetical protein